MVNSIYPSELMLTLKENHFTNHKHALLQLGFRPLFLLGSAFSAVAMMFWILTIGAFIQYVPYGGSQWWHGHEMIFGFVAAIIVGFLLTAVQNWTGIPGVKGKHLLLLVSLWLLARILLFFNVQHWITALVDITFLPLASLYLAIPIIKVRQMRNIFFVPLLLLLTVANGLTHSNIYWPEFPGFQMGTYGAIMLIITLMMIMGGRVIPFFTANATGTDKPIQMKWIEISSLSCGWILTVIFLTGLNTIVEYSWLLAVLCVITFSINIFRWSRWRFFSTLTQPLLWSLHISYLFIPVGHLLLGIHFINNSISIQTALHVLTAGAMGTMIISMISRVSLGHTGRPLNPHWLMTIAFSSIIIAAILRFIGSMQFHQYFREILFATGLLWILGYSLFVILYKDILTKPRMDNRPG